MQEKRTFDQWMVMVDRWVDRLAMLSVYDLADQPFRDWYDAGMSPKTAAEDTLENEGYPVDLL